MTVLPRAVLFVRLRLLGDIIMSIPTLLRFKQVHPHIPAFYALEESFRDLGPLLPGIDDFFVMPHNATIRDYRTWRKWIRNKGIDTVIDLHSGPKSALMTRISGCSTRVGYRTKNRNWAYNRLNDNRIKDNKILHSVANQVSLLEEIGIRTETIPAYQTRLPLDSLPPPPLPSPLTTAHGRQVVLHVGAGNRFRYWGDLQFEELITALVSAGTTCHLIGHNAAESSRALKWSKISASMVFNWVGKLSIPDTLSLINQSDCYFGVDSGPLHLASLTPTPIVGIYGPNIPEISGPWRQRDITILQASMTCRPCSQRACQYDTIRCMEGINAQQVFQSILGYFVK